MRITRTFIFVLAFSAGLLAHAAPITYNFAFNGVGANNNNQSVTLTGSTTIDTSTGLVQNITFTFGGTTASGVYSQPDATKVLVGATGSYTFVFTNLVNLRDANSIGQATFTLTTPDSQTFNGHITAAPATVAVTPEPSTFALLGTGLLSVAGVLRRRPASWNPI